MLNTFELSDSKISTIQMDTGYYKNDQNSNIPFRDKKKLYVVILDRILLAV